MTPTIVVGNSECKLEGVTPTQFADLRELMHYKTPGDRYSSSGYVPKRYLLDRRGTFPTGLLYIAEEYFKSKRVAVVLKVNRCVPAGPRGDAPVMRLGFTPYPEQVAAAEACRTAKHGRGIVVAPTGSGKSLIIALIIDRLKVPTLVVVPSLELKRQTIAGLKAVFGSNVGSLAQSPWVAVENVDALDPKKPLKEYGAVLIDEFHHSAAKTYRDLNKKAWAGVYYRFGLTATPFRSQDHERLLLESVLSKVIYALPYSVAVKKGYIVPVEAYFYTLPKRPVEGCTWAQVYSELVTGNKDRNDLIQRVMLRLNQEKVSTLCLVKEIKHGQVLSADGAFAFASGVSEETPELIRQFNAQGMPVLIGTTGILGEGVDTKPAEYVIIAGLGKSRNAFMQQVGRGLRRYGDKTSCKVILFKDPSHKWTLAHFREQCRILKEEYGVVPVKLEV